MVTAPATSANLGPGFDALALALDLGNEVRITRRPGPLEVRLRGEGADELERGPGNLLCRALAAGLGALDGLMVECVNRIPLGRGLGSSAAAVCAGLAAANALGDLRWAPAELLARATDLEGHADNAAACLEGGIVAVSPGPRVRRIAPPDGLAYCVIIPASRVSTARSRATLPAVVALSDAADSLARAVGLALALADGRLDDLPPLLADRLHEPYRAPLCPGLDALRGLVDGRRCLGVTISGSGPSLLLWCRAAAAGEVAAQAREVLAAEGVPAEAVVMRAAPSGVRARWMGSEAARLARAVG